MADQQHEANPRSATEPMAFTRGEFLRGALAAWIWFLVLHLALAVLIFQGLAPVILMFTIPWSFAALIVGSPIAFLLGRALRRRSSLLLHVASFALFGAAIGTATMVVAVWAALAASSDTTGPSGYIALLTPIALAGAPAVAIGWWWTSRRSLAGDLNGSPAYSRVDSDALAEDAAS